VIDLVSKAKVLVQERDKVENDRNTKRRRLDTNDCHEDSTNIKEGEEEARDGRSDDRILDGGGSNGNESSAPKPPQLAPGYNIWWDSTEAQMLFNASKEKETTVDRLQDLIAVLDNATLTVQSYKTIVDGHDVDDIMSDHKKENIQMRTRYLAQAYRIAIEEMPFKTWNDCCQEAINHLAAVHIHYVKSAKVLERWNVEFRQRKTFCVNMSRGKRDLPAFLEAHPIGVRLD
jgi:hypothetical protein